MEPFDLDLLQEGGWSDLLWSLKRFSPQGYKFALTRTPQQIKSDVLNSRRVQHVIEKVIFVSSQYHKHLPGLRSSYVKIISINMQWGYIFLKKTSALKENTCFAFYTKVDFTSCAYLFKFANKI